MRKIADAPAPTTPEFSILALGRQLTTLQRQNHLLDLLCGQLGPEPPHKTLAPDEKRLAQRTARNAQEASSRQIEAVERLILASRAETPADALVQLIVASSRLSLMRNRCSQEEGDAEEALVDSALQCAARALARHLALPLSQVCGRAYVSAWADPWPDVDLSSVSAEPGSHTRCIDGSE